MIAWLPSCRMTHFADKLLVHDRSNDPIKVKESQYIRKERLLSRSDKQYERYIPNIIESLDSRN